MSMKVGIGFDAHPFVQGRRLKLGGLDWEFDRGLAGHSDGDVLLHAVSDALLGAAGLGSIGEHFSDSDPSNAGRDSAEMLSRILKMTEDRGFSVVNVDSTVIGEAPKLAPRRIEVQARVASILNLPAERVSVRGTSTNGLGFPGRREGLAAMAVVLLESR
jgi:2-C-methyl-D-erythritol 2,4-cyclodiphosphate synthase